MTRVFSTRPESIVQPILDHPEWLVERDFNPLPETLDCLIPIEQIERNSSNL